MSMAASRRGASGSKAKVTLHGFLDGYPHLRMQCASLEVGVPCCVPCCVPRYVPCCVLAWLRVGTRHIACRFFHTLRPHDPSPLPPAPHCPFSTSLGAGQCHAHSCRSDDSSCAACCLSLCAAAAAGKASQHQRDVARPQPGSRARARRRPRRPPADRQNGQPALHDGVHHEQVLHARLAHPWRVRVGLHRRRRVQDGSGCVARAQNARRFRDRAEWGPGGGRGSFVRASSTRSTAPRTSPRHRTPAKA